MVNSRQVVGNISRLRKLALPSSKRQKDIRLAIVLNDLKNRKSISREEDLFLRETLRGLGSDSHSWIKPLKRPILTKNIPKSVRRNKLSRSRI